MRRREFLRFLCGLAGAAGAPATPAIANNPRVGCFWPGGRNPNLGDSGLRQGLREHGYVFGQNLELEERYAENDPSRSRELLAELFGLRIDALVTQNYALIFAHTLTANIPIIGVAPDFVGVGLAATLARPGGNVTGLSLLSGEFSPKWLEYLKAVVPHLKRVAFLSDFSGTSAIEKRGLDEVAPRFGVTLTQLDAYPGNLDESLEAITRENFDGLIVAEVPEASTTRIAALAATNRMPAIYGFGGAVRQGGLMSYSADAFEIWRAVAGYVDRVLKGAKPADLPIEQATKITLAVNLQAARALGLDIPPTLLAAADEVIE